MASVLNTNMSSLNTQRHLSKAQNNLNNSLQRLSSGLRINSAKDDAAGLAISQRMTSQIKGLNVAERNANDAISYSQTAEGALAEMGDILQRIRELSVQSANATNSAGDRKSLNDEVNQLVSELNRFAITTEFNGQKILNGDNSVLNFHVGANANQTIAASTSDFRTNKYGSYQLGGEVLDFSGRDVVDIISSGNADGAAPILGKALDKAAVKNTGDLILNGFAGTAKITLSEADSVADIANKINTYQITGLKASARTETIFFVAGTGSFTFNFWASNANDKPENIETVSISFTIDEDLINGVFTENSLNTMITAFNEYSAKTGTYAKRGENDYSIVLVNEEGKNLSIAKTTIESCSAAIAIGNDFEGFGQNIMENAVGTITVAGQVLIDSEKSYSITTQAGLVVNAGVLGADESNAGNNYEVGRTDAAMTYGSELKRVDSIDITTVKGANQAIHIVDMALDAVNSQRAKFGALQNRFESTISNLKTSSENVSAARSRIQDSDFAAETANLSRNQVLQQAATSMLVQANQLPNNILTLLG